MTRDGGTARAGRPVVGRPVVGRPVVGRPVVGRYEWSVVAATVFCTISAAVPPFLVGVLAVHMRDDFPFTSVHLAMSVAVYYAVSAAMSVPAGRIAHRYGARRCLRGAALLAGISLGVLAVAGNWQLVLLAQFVAGAGNSVIQPVVGSVLNATAPVRYRGAAFGLNQSAIPLSTLFAALLIPSLSLTVGWRWCAAVLAAEAIVVAFLVPRLRSAVPRGGPRRERRGRPSPGPLLLLASGTAVGSMAATNLPTFLTTSAVEAGMTVAAAAGLQMAGSVVCILVRISAGWLGDGRRPEYFRPAAAMLLAGGVGYVFLATGPVWLLTIGAVVAFGLGWGWSGLFNLSVALRYGDDVAHAIGITQAGVYAGAMSGPLLFGVVFERFGRDAAWSVTALLAFAAAALLVLGARDPARRGVRA
ncbi:MFS transporter [Actinomadura sp. KC345]|uniref:MFS transporter n=1 Tax=Actinomadura sp. KC345 TaxID=2530371 RepID=UPI0010487337|nr:MFS transporter [Actinomadura sp. KC345]TDC44609.1 MFS transporter [Actinomadura sp. KC345]